ncbi:MAG TPA: glycosyltransferase [Candidatus Hydrogenedentes bacterium]|nr:glycosyltransferase [Candidatus Hydrogenedentota bacterium]HIJ74436.1 glycosyltransferase [Candidatus Hydrogenedentota bacterium]
MSHPISIVIPAFNQVQCCRECVASVLANTRRAHQLILVDNGSTDGAGAFFDAIPGATVVHSKTNLGFAGGVNLGLREAEGHVVLLNSDTLVPQGWLERLERALVRSDDIGMVGPMTNYASGCQLIPDLDLRTLDEISAFAAKLARDKARTILDVNRLVAFCILIRDSVVREVGLFDESFGIGNFEDDDYCVRVLRAGYRLCVAEDCFIFHYGHRTFDALGVTREQLRSLIDENEATFVTKWGEFAHARALAEQLNVRARNAMQQGDQAKALRFLKEGIEVFPAFEQNYNDLGALLWDMGEGDRAYQCFVQALSRNPENQEARDNLLEAARALGKEDDAKAFLGERLRKGLRRDYS